MHSKPCRQAVMLVSPPDLCLLWSSPNLKPPTLRQSDLSLWSPHVRGFTLLPTSFSPGGVTFRPLPLHASHPQDGGLRISPQLLTVGHTSLYSLNTYLFLPLHYVIHPFSLRNFWKIKTSRRKPSHWSYHLPHKTQLSYFDVFSPKFFFALMF